MKKYIILIILSALHYSHSSLSMTKRRDTQRPCITDPYILPIRYIVTKQKFCPSTLQKQINTLMKHDYVYNEIFTNSTSAGLVIKQTAKKHDPFAPYLVALTLNTPGTIKWLEDEILKQKNNLVIAYSLGYMMRKLVHYDTDPIATLESIFQLRVYLGEKGQEEFLHHKVKAIKRAYLLKKSELITFLRSH